MRARVLLPEILMELVGVQRQDFKKSPLVILILSLAHLGFS